jgi:protein phosphatase
VAAQSHPGLSGKNNEDAFAVSAFQLSGIDPTPALFAVVADGIGGHRAGEVAAEISVNVISHQVAMSDGRHPTQIMSSAIQEAGRQIYEQAQNIPDRQGMGATCACVWVIGNRLYIAAVGDSRIYLLRGGFIQQLTIDHTWIQEALTRGIINPNQARGHPNAHIIRRFLGSAAPTQTDLRLRLEKEESDEQSLANQGFELHSDDIILVCSDGLTDMVSDEEIQVTLSPPARKKPAVVNQSTLETGVQSLVDLACQRGGNDNITIIALRFPQTPASRPGVRYPARLFTGRLRPSAWRRPVAMGLVGFLSLLILTTALWLGVNWLRNRPGTPNPGIAPELQVSTPLTSTPLLASTPTTALSEPPTLSPPTRLPTTGPTLTPWPTHTRLAGPTATLAYP